MASGERREAAQRRHYISPRKLSRHLLKRLQRLEQKGRRKGPIEYVKLVIAHMARAAARRRDSEMVHQKPSRALEQKRSFTQLTDRKVGSSSARGQSWQRPAISRRGGRCSHWQRRQRTSGRPVHHALDNWRWI